MSLVSQTAPWPQRLHPVCQRSSGSTTHQRMWWSLNGLSPPAAPLPSTTCTAVWTYPLGPGLIPVLCIPRTTMDTSPPCTWILVFVPAAMQVDTAQQPDGLRDTACTSAVRWPIRMTTQACTVSALCPTASPYANPKSPHCRPPAQTL